MGEGFKIRRQLPIFDTNIYLYNEGDECTALTGGYVQGFTYVSPSYSKQATYLQIVSAAGGVGRYTSNNKVDLTSYSKLYIDLSMTLTGSGTYSNCLLVVSNDKTLETHVAYVGYIKNTGSTALTLTNQIYELDVSALNGSYYVQFHIAAASGLNNTGKCHKIWVEV